MRGARWRTPHRETSSTSRVSRTWDSSLPSSSFRSRIRELPRPSKHRMRTNLSMIADSGAGVAYRYA
jgi:hypothetical protein